LLAFVPQRTAIGIVAAIAALHVFAERKLLVLPTDARELDWALRWREQLGGGEVAALTRVERRMLVLPMSGNGLPIVAPIDEHGSATFGATPRWYYRSSLCSTPEGAPLCDRFESAHRLRLIESRRFPSIASLPWEPLPPGEIEVSLYAVE
jgi:hypothetical protein